MLKSTLKTKRNKNSPPTELKHRRGTLFTNLIEVESEMGQGTNFSFTTEFKIPSEEEILLKKAKDIYEGDGLYKSDTLVGIRVLLVDDNEINQDVLKSIVEEVGMLATVTSSGEEAVEKVRTDEYDIVLMDIRMPGMDGYEATAEIRKMKSSSELPIIAVTASASPDERIRCIESDIGDYITKPIDRKALFKSIANLLNRSSDKYKNLNSREKLNVDVNLTLIGEEESYRPSFQIEGIEIEEALNHLNNDEELFLKVLRKFERNHKKVVDEIREALALDDSPEMIDILRNILPKNIRGQVALNGPSALKILETSSELPDLILLDVMMPEMNGFEVCKRIKNNNRLKEIPIIFISSLNKNFDKVLAFRMGAVDYITKPFYREEVLAWFSSLE